MLLKKIFALIILFCPLILVAQSFSKDNFNKKHAPGTNGSIKKNAYADDEIRLEKMEKPVRDRIHSIKKLISKKSAEFLKISELPSKNIAQQNIDSLEKILGQLFTQQITMRFNFIRNNPSSFLSLDRLSMILSGNAELPHYIDTITTLYNDLNKSIQNSVPGRHFKLMLLNLNKSKVGSLAPAFKVNDIDNNPISLSSYLHKDCVIVDFWASWCVPCREDIPSLKLIYKKYSNKGLEIICVSKDDDAILWKKAIGEDKIQNWKHILAPFSDQKNDSLITNKYFVYSIPVKILINKDGIIIGRWSGSGEENMEALEKLLDKNLGN